MAVIDYLKALPAAAAVALEGEYLGGSQITDEPGIVDMNAQTRADQA